MSVKTYTKDPSNYYNAEVCQKEICYPTQNLIRIQKKQDVNNNSIMFLNSKSDNFMFIPTRVIESDFVSNIRGTLDESASCWNIDPCHQNIDKYCCKDKAESKNASNNNIYLIIIIIIVALTFLGIGVGLFMY